MCALTAAPEGRELEQLAINVIRGLAMDAPRAADSGHSGTAMALAPLAHVLWTRVMNYDPTDPSWPDRDRFVLSNGHASILLYSMLHLTGYDLSLEDLREFRQWGSATPGHPEARHTAGVEVTTGPLGQGVGNSVGMAVAERVLRARFGPELVDHHTFVFAGDGCFEEGISHEAASLAGHLGLGRLDLRLRRQPHHHRRADRAQLHRRRARTVPAPTAGTWTTSARSPTTPTPSRPPCAGPWRCTTAPR